MMQLEKWIIWQPIENLSKDYCIESIVDNDKGLEIILFESENKKRGIKVIFEMSVDSYKKTSEIYTYKILDEVDRKMGSDFYSNHVFFQIKNSSYLNSLSEQSYGVSDDRKLVHFCIWTVDSIIDIISDYEPKVELIEE